MVVMKELKGAYEPIDVEEKIRKFWQINNIQEKVKKQNESKPLFKFLEGPPTANGFMHIGHARGRTMKDVILRFEFMRGKKVWNRAGWDCQGLPVELEVEKKLKLKTKQDIEKVGLDIFVKECNRIVDFYIAHWRRNSEKLGLWLDYDNAYETRKDEYIEFVWWFIKKAFEKGLLKEDFKVVPACPRCETPLSSHEVSLGYATVKDPSIYVKFPLEGKKNEYILIWTTTPWTLPGDEAVSVNPEASYAHVKVSDEVWIIAEDLIDRVMKQIGITNYSKLNVFLGKTLEGTKYVQPLLQEVKEHANHKGDFDHAIICSEHVSLEEGTGCVHTAPAHGPEDFEIGAKYRVQVFCPIDQTGHFTRAGGKYSGLYFKDADSMILDDLKLKGLLVWRGEIEHEYPNCWRCDNPLLYRADKQWFLRISLKQDKLVEENKKVNWTPVWAGENRFGEWLANAEDWCISRARVWGSPFNIWRCSRCEDLKVIGTVDELKKIAKKLPEYLELHRPWIDEVVIECDNCKSEMKRVPFVVDCWLDSGVAHAASLGYLKNKDLFNELYPYDFITEAVDQTRGWFYSLLCTGVLAFNSTPFKRVLCQGHVLDKYGQKMSKSRENVIWAEDVLSKYGADIIRAYLIWKVAPEDTLLFDFEELNQMKRFLGIIWNIYMFATTYMVLDKFEPEEWPLDKVWRYLRVEDRWLLSRMQAIVRNVTENFEKLQLHKALREILNFEIEDVSRFYIRLIRRRTWIETEEMEKFAAYATLYSVLMDSLKLMNPFVPHFSEALYQVLSNSSPESINLCKWCIPREEYINILLEEDFEICRETIKAISTARQRKRFKLRWPSAKITIEPSKIEVQQALNRQKEIILTQANTKELVILKPGEKPSFIVTEAKPAPSLGSKLKSFTPQVMNELNKLGAHTVSKEILKKGQIEISVGEQRFILTKDDFKITEKIPDYISREDFTYGTVFVNVTKTSELAAEALGKEIVRRAQIMRKDMKLRIDEYVNVQIGCKDEELMHLLESVEDYLKLEVRIKNLRLNDFDKVKPIEGGYLKEWLIDGEPVKILMRKLM